MNEDKLKALLEQDKNLRDAIRMEEAEGPQMPADLNTRLMQRVQHPSAKERSKKKWWPWIAAACVAGFMMVYLTPPKDTTEEKVIVAKVEPKTVVEPKTEEKPQRENISPQATDKEFAHDGQRVRTRRTFTKPAEKPEKAPEELIAKESSSMLPKAELAQTTAPEPQPETLTERDIPITRPENLKYTPEEMALMKKQANEAYLKWVELELEIAKYHLEQTAQK